MDLNQFKEWVKEGKRTIEIKLGEINDPEHISVWAYDYKYAVGRFVTDVSELNPEQWYREKLEAQLLEATSKLEELNNS